MLTKVVKHLMVAGDPATHAWLEGTFGGVRPRGCHLGKEILVLEFEDKEVRLTSPLILADFENGDPDDVIPMMYQLLRAYEGRRFPFVDKVLTRHCSNFLKEKVPASQVLPWMIYKNRVLTSVIEGSSEVTPKHEGDLTIYESDDHTRLVLMPTQGLRGVLHSVLREKESAYHANN